LDGILCVGDHLFNVVINAVEDGALVNHHNMHLLEDQRQVINGLRNLNDLLLPFLRKGFRHVQNLHLVAIKTLQAPKIQRVSEPHRKPNTMAGPCLVSPIVIILA